MKRNIVKDKSFDLALRIVNISQVLQSEKREFVLSKQLLKSGTSVGALIRESEHAESKADFIHKMAIAQKECNESLYWIELLHASNFLDAAEFSAVHKDANEIMKLLTSIIKTTKVRMNSSK